MLDVHTTMSGRISWDLMENGEVIQSGEQPNLITDLGLDHLAQYGFWGTRDGDAGYASGIGTFRAYCCVGTGSAEPAYSDTALGAEIARTANSLGNAPTLESQTLGVYDYTFTHEFDETQGNGNLREWGYAPRVGAGVSIRGLFRDTNGNAVVLTKTSAQRLRIRHTLRVTVTGRDIVKPFVIPMTGDANNINAESLLSGRSTNFVEGYDNDFIVLSMCIQGNQNNEKGAVASVINTDTPLVVGMDMGYGATSYGDDANLTFPPYVAGSKQRFFSATWATTSANRTFYGVALGWYRYQGYYTYSHHAYRVRFKPGSEFTKDNLHRVTFTDFKVTWGRE